MYNRTNYIKEGHNIYISCKTIYLHSIKIAKLRAIQYPECHLKPVDQPIYKF